MIFPSVRQRSRVTLGKHWGGQKGWSNWEAGGKIVPLQVDDISISVYVYQTPHSAFWLSFSVQACQCSKSWVLLLFFFLNKMESEPFVFESHVHKSLLLEWEDVCGPMKTGLWIIYQEGMLCGASGILSPMTKLGCFLRCFWGPDEWWHGLKNHTGGPLPSGPYPLFQSPYAPSCSHTPLLIHSWEDHNFFQTLNFLFCSEV